MTQIGGKAGATPSELAQAVATELAKRSASSVARSEFDKRLGRKVRDQVDKAKRKLFDKLRGAD